MGAWRFKNPKKKMRQTCWLRLAKVRDWCERWRVMRLPLILCLATCAAVATAFGEDAKKPAPEVQEKNAKAAAPEISPEMKAALGKLNLPHVKINLEEWSVDVQAKVCEEYGLLEVIACFKGTRDHESVVSTEAKPSHIHTALLLLGGVPGSPAMQQMLSEDPPRFRHILPSGSPVDVSLVLKDDKGVAVERPINELVIRGKNDYGDPSQPAEDEDAKKENFPHKTFIFAGSHLLPAEGDAPRKYLADTEGNIISISTFGDEVLCLSGFHEKANDSLVWQADSEILKPGEVILRLRPHKQAVPKNPEK